VNWTTDEIRYMEEHAGEGAASIAEHLNRTVISVKVQASRQGIFLTPRWRCPNCGCLTAKPLNAKTGWCANCTMEARREQIAKDVRELEDEVARRERNEQARQALYSKRSRLRKKLRENSPNQ
jgi:hypothetical protein